MKHTTVNVSAINASTGAVLNDRAAALLDCAASGMMELRKVKDKRAMLEEIRRELATMTERERVQLLLELKKDFLKEVNRRSGCVLFATEPT